MNHYDPPPSSTLGAGKGFTAEPEGKMKNNEKLSQGQ